MRVACGFALLVSAALGTPLTLLSQPAPLSDAVSPGSASSSQHASHWAFQPVSMPQVMSDPDVHPVDAFLETDQVTLADPRTLIRRMTYDLTGLPPSFDEVESFTAEWAAASESGKQEVTARLVDRLLAAPAYGERWGRKWLDVARYADTAGENTDRPLHEIWRYRNYVIDAFNRDLPYDQFVREQIAGDLLAPEEPERYSDLICATGFLSVARRFGHEIDKDMHLTYEDVIDTVGKSILGLSLGCARCHDHKYDPVSTQDYYGWYGIFASSKFSYPGCEATQTTRDMTPLWTSEERAHRRQPFDDALATLDKSMATLQESQAKVSQAMAAAATGAIHLLAQGEFDDGGAQPIATDAAPLTVRVRRGSLIQLTVYPRGNYGADTTLLELAIEETTKNKRRWVVPADVVDHFLESNPHPGHHDEPATWCFLDPRKGLALLSETVRDHQGQTGLHIWRQDENPSAFVNATDSPIKVWTTLPARSLFVHPAPDGPVAVAWLSPLTGEVRIHGQVADGHPGGGDGVSWTLEHWDTDMEEPMAGLASVAKQIGEVSAQRATLISREPVVPVAYGVTEGQFADAPLQQRGDPEQLGETIPRKNLDLLGGQALNHTNASGRLELAQWLTSPTNPLTARVMANRIWQGHFGRGIVGTPSDFGTRGASPTHPELLDWLAATFVEKGWSVKAMHRVIMSSKAYQQTSSPSLNLVSARSQPEADRNTNPFVPFSRRRLEAEEIRDTLLLLSGELDTAPGQGHPFPAATTTFTQHDPFKSVYESSKRSVYLMTQRIQRHPFLGLFDGPDANASCAERSTSTVPTQALYFLNDRFFHARAEALAHRLLAKPAAERIDAMHRLCLQRPATDEEQILAHEFLQAYTRELKLEHEAVVEKTAYAPAAWSAYARTLLASNEMLYVD